MKIVGMMALHYGIDYLPWAVRSVIDDVDEMWFVHTPVGNHAGGPSDLPLPEGEQARYLYEAAHEAAGKKMRWYSHVGWQTEGEQRDTIFQLAPDADRVLVVDSDEIYGTGLAAAAIAASASRPNIRNWRLPFIHMWKDLHHAILHDPAYPVRLINPRAADGDATFDAEVHDAAKRELLARTLDHTPEFHTRVVHCGYAITPELMRYKMTIHGHRSELRRDIDWLHDKYLNPAATRDLHPVGSDYWNAEPIDPFVYLPGWMIDHPLMHEAVAA
jgi:hypothetical protein